LVWRGCDDQDGGDGVRDSKKNLLTLFVTNNDASVILATVILFFVFMFGSEGFLSSYNIFNVSRMSALFVFIALGQAMVIVVGGMNLSLGAIGGLTVVCLGYSLQVLRLSPTYGVIVAMLVGTGLGALNGFIVTKLNLNSFVATLATSFVFTGIVYGISRGNAYQGIPASFTLLGRRGIGPIPYLLILAVLALLILFYVFRYTALGRRILATGGNIEAARLSGINTTRMIVIANTASGVFGALAGVFTVSWLGIAPPSAGQDWLITSFAISVIGGTALKGGKISPLGFLVSGILLALVKNGLIMLSVNIYYEQTFLGLIILGAVMLESARTRYMRTRM
jgi:ribose transport system permease protein